MRIQKDNVNDGQHQRGCRGWYSVLFCSDDYDYTQGQRGLRHNVNKKDNVDTNEK